MPLTKNANNIFLFITDGKMFGFGFVQFTTVNEATKAITEMNEKSLLGEYVTSVYKTLTFNRNLWPLIYYLFYFVCLICII